MGFVSLAYIKQVKVGFASPPDILRANTGKANQNLEEILRERKEGCHCRCASWCVAVFVAVFVAALSDGGEGGGGANYNDRKYRVLLNYLLNCSERTFRQYTKKYSTITSKS
jgi:hypothetical protein